ncbi:MULTISPECIES: restriction endonuclease subunit S [Enterobacterales]|uniref:restriction endonuclease subunit S n=1 Tax=Enterobacterales TaxID=91347 RepID=UPI0009497624|nr:MULTISPECIES: restriction endonuclease subunit S [Enterobacterales]NCH51563.1 restriction endonuclease subunit S [Cronobacter malonaticus]CAI2446304.1 Type I restriction enzyme EcoKI specificity protein [Serratia marcescens]
MVPKLRFKSFHSQWFNSLLGDIGTFKNGLNKDKSEFGYGVPFVNLTDVFGKLEIKDNKNLPLVNANKKEVKDYSLLNGDVLFIRSSVKPTGVGETSVVTEDLENTVFSGFLIRYRNKSLLTSYKKHYFWHPGFRTRLLSLSTTSANTNINQDSLSSLDINFPCEEEQKKIADFLSSVDDKIALLDKQYKQLCQYKKGMMQKIFSQKMRFKNNNGGEFPEWETCKLKKLLIPTLREVKKPSENFLSIGIRSHFKGTFHKDNQDPNKISVDKLFLVHEGDFILNITFAWEGALAIARKEDNLGYVSHRFPTYTFNKEFIISEFFRYIYTLPKFLTYLDLCSPGGAGRNRVLKKSEFLEIEIDRPCLAEQTKIANFFSALDDKIVVKKAELDTFRTWKQGLLQQMFV